MRIRQVWAELQKRYHTRVDEQHDRAHNREVRDRYRAGELTCQWMLSPQSKTHRANGEERHRAQQEHPVGATRVEGHRDETKERSEHAEPPAQFVAVSKHEVADRDEGEEADVQQGQIGGHATGGCAGKLRNQMIHKGPFYRVGYCRVGREVSRPSNNSEMTPRLALSVDIESSTRSHSTSELMVPNM